MFSNLECPLLYFCFFLSHDISKELPCCWVITQIQNYPSYKMRINMLNMDFQFSLFILEIYLDLYTITTQIILFKLKSSTYFKKWFTPWFHMLYCFYCKTFLKFCKPLFSFWIITGNRWVVGGTSTKWKLKRKYKQGSGSDCVLYIICME